MVCFCSPRAMWCWKSGSDRESNCRVLDCCSVSNSPQISSCYIPMPSAGTVAPMAILHCRDGTMHIVGWFCGYCCVGLLDVWLRRSHFPTRRFSKKFYRAQDYGHNYDPGSLALSILHRCIDPQDIYPQHLRSSIDTPLLPFVLMLSFPFSINGVTNSFQTLAV